MINKVNYNRQTINDFYYKDQLKVEEYTDIDGIKLSDWLNKIFKKYGDKIKISMSVWDESSGCGMGPSVIHLTPFIEREENDKEYNKRIKEEEEEFKKYQERERLIKEASEQYKKDLEEYERIKNKYHW